VWGDRERGSGVKDRRALLERSNDSPVVLIYPFDRRYIEEGVSFGTICLLAFFRGRVQGQHLLTGS
jgi:hypothetical protein